MWDSLTGQNLQSLGTPGATEVVSILHNPERRRFLTTGWNRQISVFEDKVCYAQCSVGSYSGTSSEDCERCFSCMQGWLHIL